MAKRMLIDASHAEETRVVVADGTRLDEFDFESATRKQLKGNVYLAKVMRVEPSLQAAFVDYGGNRHGFLPFNEIHPDYYQIPVEDREALYAEQAAVGAEEPAAAAPPATAGDEADNEAAAATEAGSDPAPANAPEFAEAATGESGAPENGATDDGAAAEGDGNGDESADSDIEVVGGDEMDDLERRRLHASRSLLSRRYHIQEVIKKRQILLVQVVKDERGNKGAALTTYLSLAGRYIVLMPNAIRGGGISRKIVNAEDRRRLKKIMSDLDIPARMAVIVRTAGLSRSKTEIKRDLEYLLRRWQNIRDLTMESMAPCVINEEANLIRRSIRDLYTRDIEQILIEGDEGYRTAKDLMKTMIPSHAARVRQYRDRIPLFVRYQVESQLDSMYSPERHLKSGGYLVINPTEALVAIDVNSGRATRERTIEDTALQTNLEAAEEIARQLRLRDLAGLIVIDFIDMDESRHRRAVERKLKEAMRNDRARIRMGRISPFGLMELSRQRLRPSLAEASMERCTSCGGTGVKRSVESSAVHALRAIEEEGLQERSAEIRVRVPASVGLYILNRKRGMLEEIEKRYDFAVGFEQDDSLVPPSYAIERVSARSAPVDEPAEEDAGEAAQTQAQAPAGGEAAGEAAEPAKRRRRRRRKPRGEAAEETTAEAGTAGAPAEPAEAESRADDADDDDAEAADARADGNADGTADEAPRPKRRRRGRRGGRSRTAKPQEDSREGGPEAAEEAAPGETQAEAQEAAQGEAQEAVQDGVSPPLAAADAAPAAALTSPMPDPEPPVTPVAPAGDDAAPAPMPAPMPAVEAPVMPTPQAVDGAQAAVAAGQIAAIPADGGNGAGPSVPAPAPADAADDGADDGADDDAGDGADGQPRRRGWWQRLSPSTR